MQTTHKSYKYLFGPITSRRYGLSLGVDLALPKTCSFNCIFCQLGETPQTTIKRTGLPPIKEVINELNAWRDNGGRADFITVAGSGEPTLHKDFGEILRHIHNTTDFRSLLLSNGSLFSIDEVRRQATEADVVKLSLHAWNQDTFQQITRADPGLSFDTIIDGYQKFRELYSGRIDLEVFVVPGINDKPEQMQKIATIARSFNPDSIYLNSAVRPPADSNVKEAPPALIEELSLIFDTPTAHKPTVVKAAGLQYHASTLVELISRHPASLNQLAEQFDMPHNAMRKELDLLKSKHLLKLSLIKGELFALPETS